jgi:hypothetical protein
MLKFSIKKKPQFLQAMDSLTEKWKGRQTLLDREIPMPWGKVEFIKWFEDHVRGKFKEGDLVTWKRTPETHNHAPYHMKVVYVNEFHHTAKYNTFQNEPEVIHVQGMSNVITHRCPSELRQLSTEEKALVNLQNLKAQGTA